MTEFAFPTWTGRNDGSGRQQARWHSTIAPVDNAQAGFALLGFVSDEGVRRNQGRTGAAEGPVRPSVLHWGQWPCAHLLMVRT